MHPPIDCTVASRAARVFLVLSLVSPVSALEPPRIPSLAHPNLHFPQPFFLRGQRAAPPKVEVPLPWPWWNEEGPRWWERGKALRWAVPSAMLAMAALIPRLPTLLYLRFVRCNFRLDVPRPSHLEGGLKGSFPSSGRAPPPNPPPTHTRPTALSLSLCAIAPSALAPLDQWLASLPTPFWTGDCPPNRQHACPAHHRMKAGHRLSE